MPSVSHDPEDDEEPTEEQKQVALVVERLDSLGETYIDLEKLTPGQWRN